MPAVHDLLPRFVCVEDAADARPLTAVDVADLGGDKDQFQASQHFSDTLESGPPLPATAPSPASGPVYAQHGALASGKTARLTVADYLLEDDHLGPDQADGGLGLRVPDYVTPDTGWQLQLTGTDDPAGIHCTISAVDADFTRTARLEADGDDTLRTTLTVPDAGLYRVTVTADFAQTLTQLVFAGPAEQDVADD